MGNSLKFKTVGDAGAALWQALWPARYVVKQSKMKGRVGREAAEKIVARNPSLARDAVSQPMDRSWARVQLRWISESHVFIHGDSNDSRDEAIAKSWKDCKSMPNYPAGSSALHMAFYTGEDDLVAWFLSLGANTALKNAFDEVPGQQGMVTELSRGFVGLLAVPPPTLAQFPGMEGVDRSIPWVYTESVKDAGAHVIRAMEEADSEDSFVIAVFAAIAYFARVLHDGGAGALSRAEFLACAVGRKKAVSASVWSARVASNFAIALQTADALEAAGPGSSAAGARGAASGAGAGSAASPGDKDLL